MTVTVNRRLSARVRSQNRFVMNTDWNGYTKILEAVGNRHVKVTYDRGRLELLSPSQKHESAKCLIACLLETAMNTRRVDYQSGGSTTFRGEDLDRGLEPDACWWIAHCNHVIGHDVFDTLHDPPPDLAVEVEITRSSLDRMNIYETLGVPEIWRWSKKGTLTVHCLDAKGTYRRHDTSPTFPWLPLDVVRRFVLMGLSETTTARTVWAFQDWLNDHP